MNNVKKVENGNIGLSTELASFYIVYRPVWAVYLGKSVKYHKECPCQSAVSETQHPQLSIYEVGVLIQFAELHHLPESS